MVQSEKPHVRVCFAYEHQYRVVDVERVWTSRGGNDLITGIDPDKGEYRTFRVDRIKGKIRLVDVPRPGKSG
jgi:predicted DNA-binding transcriptional regulator YafY